MQSDITSVTHYERSNASVRKAALTSGLLDQEEIPDKSCSAAAQLETCPGCLESPLGCRFSSQSRSRVCRRAFRCYWEVWIISNWTGCRWVSSLVCPDKSTPSRSSTCSSQSIKAVCANQQILKLNQWTAPEACEHPVCRTPVSCVSPSWNSSLLRTITSVSMQFTLWLVFLTSCLMSYALLRESGDPADKQLPQQPLLHLSPSSGIQPRPPSPPLGFTLIISLY